MKKSLKLLALSIVIGIPALFLVSWIPVSSDITSIHWTSSQYKDIETGDMISMTNEFECTPEGLSWSLFEGALPVSKVEWNLNNANETNFRNKGSITYHIDGEKIKGTISFYLGASARAETDIRTDVGKLKFKFQFSKEQTAISTNQSLALIDNDQ